MGLLNIETLHKGGLTCNGWHLHSWKPYTTILNTFNMHVTAGCGLHTVRHNLAETA